MQKIHDIRGCPGSLASNDHVDIGFDFDGNYSGLNSWIWSGGTSGPRHAAKIEDITGSCDDIANEVNSVPFPSRATTLGSTYIGNNPASPGGNVNTVSRTLERTRNDKERTLAST